MRAMLTYWPVVVNEKHFRIDLNLRLGCDKIEVIENRLELGGREVILHGNKRNNIVIFHLSKRVALTGVHGCNLVRKPNINAQHGTLGGMINSLMAVEVDLGIRGPTLFHPSR